MRLRGILVFALCVWHNDRLTCNAVFTFYNPLYTTGCVNYANEPSQAALELPSQHVYDVTASQQGSCVDSRRCGAFDHRMNIQNVSSRQLYSWLRRVYTL